GKIEKHGKAGSAHTPALVAHIFCIARSNIARHQVSEGRVFPFKEIVAFAFGNAHGVGRFKTFHRCLRNPYPSVVAKRLRHEGEFRLVMAGDRYTGGMYLSKTGVTEQCAFLVGAPDGCRVRSFGIRREIEYVAVTTGAE